MTLTYDQVTAITHDTILDKFAMGVFKSSVALERFKSKMVVEDGGNKILAPLAAVDDTGSTGEFYSPKAALNLNEYDGITASEHEWRYIYEQVVIYKSDLAKNGGKAGQLRLLELKIKQAMAAMAQRMMKGILSDGGASLGAADTDQFDGINGIIATSSTYGGIATSDLAHWSSYVDDNSGSLRTLTQALIDKTFDQACEYPYCPTLGLYSKGVMTKFKGLLTAFQRTLREDTVNGLGHGKGVIVYNGVDHIIENNMPASTLFYVSEDYLKLHVQKDNNFRKQSISSLETADALLERIFFYGNIVANERKFHSRLNDITV